GGDVQRQLGRREPIRAADPVLPSHTGEACGKGGAAAAQQEQVGTRYRAKYRRCQLFHEPACVPVVGAEVADQRARVSLEVFRPDAVSAPGVVNDRNVARYGPPAERDLPTPTERPGPHQIGPRRDRHPDPAYDTEQGRDHEPMDDRGRVLANGALAKRQKGLVDHEVNYVAALCPTSNPPAEGEIQRPVPIGVRHPLHEQASGSRRRADGTIDALHPFTIPAASETADPY